MSSEDFLNKEDMPTYFTEKLSERRKEYSETLKKIKEEDISAAASFSIGYTEGVKDAYKHRVGLNREEIFSNAIKAILEMTRER